MKKVWHTFCFILGAGWGGPNRLPGDQSFTDLKSGPAPEWSGEEGREVVQGLNTGLFSKLVPWYITLDKGSCQQSISVELTRSGSIPVLFLNLIWKKADEVTSYKVLGVYKFAVLPPNSPLLPTNTILGHKQKYKNGDELTNYKVWHLQ